MRFSPEAGEDMLKLFSPLWGRMLAFKVKQSPAWAILPVHEMFHNILILDSGLYTFLRVQRLAKESSDSVDLIG